MTRRTRTGAGLALGADLARWRRMHGFAAAYELARMIGVEAAVVRAAELGYEPEPDDRALIDAFLTRWKGH